jgi:GcrA cell cycle regulator
MLATIWDDPKNVDLLKKMWTEGKSASEIALAIGQGATRAAVIGKVHRLKMAKRSNVAIDTQHKESANPSKKPHRNQGQVTAKGIVSRVAARAQHRQRQTTAAKVQNRDNTPFRAGSLPPERDEGVDVTTLVGFADRKIGHQCSWVHGDPLEAGSGFCGKPVKPGTEWCPEHWARVYSGRTALA